MVLPRRIHHGRRGYYGGVLLVVLPRYCYCDDDDDDVSDCGWWGVGGSRWSCVCTVVVGEEER